jgi:hypothetical protein
MNEMGDAVSGSGLMANDRYDLVLLSPDFARKHLGYGKSRGVRQPS